MTSSRLISTKIDKLFGMCVRRRRATRPKLTKLFHSVFVASLSVRLWTNEDTDAPPVLTTSATSSSTPTFTTHGQRPMRVSLRYLSGRHTIIQRYTLDRSPASPLSSSPAGRVFLASINPQRVYSRPNTPSHPSTHRRSICGVPLGHVCPLYPARVWWAGTGLRDEAKEGAGNEKAVQRSRRKRMGYRAGIAPILCISLLALYSEPEPRTFREEIVWKGGAKSWPGEQKTEREERMVGKVEEEEVMKEP